MIIQIINYNNGNFSLDSSILGSNSGFISDEVLLSGVIILDISSEYTLYQYKASSYLCFGADKLVVVVSFARSGYEY